MFRFAVRVRPGARRTAVGGRWDGALGPALVVAVAAPAVEGKANEALRRAVADAFGVRRQAVRVAAGERGRDKWLVVDLDEATAAHRLRTLLGG
ncbi:DUF167 domain-containing protein [Actinoalloteichus spitiensis]|uniref:DUF167 domain-containing protein n=1 Tax=Actinoalloteichus spitiensis TaxID=252394 RepID=UPI000360E09C|nr:DUF167 domain-containing protein [Actinoalloteichus spitiensis]